jgi:hypothetical protein
MSAALATANTGCFLSDALKNIKGMNGSVDDMNSKISQTNENMNKTNSLLQSAYQDGRQGGGSDQRIKHLEAMNKASAIKNKLANAVAYMFSMEYQLWKGVGNDDSYKLEELMGTSMLEFFEQSYEYTKSPHGKRSVAPDSDNNEMNNAYALAASLHRVNEEAKDTWDRLERGAPPSAFDLIADTLIHRHEIEAKPIDYSRGAPAVEYRQLLSVGVRPYQYEILKFAEQAKYLLQLRANFLPGVAVADISTVADHKGLPKLFVGAGMYLFSWQAKLEQNTNTIMLGYDVVALREAIRARDVLRAIGMADSEIYDSKFAKVLSHMTIKPGRIPQDLVKHMEDFARETGESSELDPLFVHRQTVLKTFGEYVTSIVQNGPSMDLGLIVP